MNQITHVFISSEKIMQYLNFSRNLATKVHCILLSRSQKKFFPLSSNINLSRTQQIEFTFSTGEKVELPKSFLDKFLLYLKTQHDVNKILGECIEFDCGAFVHFLNGIPYRNNQFNESDWDIALPENLNPGDSIITGITIIDGDIIIPKDAHYSIYLGKGLFMGKGGGTGAIIIYDISTLNEIYPFEYILKIIPILKKS